MGRVVALLWVVLLAGCATAYQKEGLTGGFDEAQLDQNIVRVTFKGNGYTSRERAADLALLRCAEITLADGYQYFAIIDTQQASRKAILSTPSQSYTTSNVAGSVYGSGNAAYGSATGTSQTITHAGLSYAISAPSATDTIVMLHDRSEVHGYTYDAQFLYNSLSQKYGVGKN